MPDLSRKFAMTDTKKVMSSPVFRLSKHISDATQLHTKSKEICEGEQTDVN